MNIRDRIKELRRVPASSLRPNPKNWRTHPKEQADALRGTLAEIGFAEALVARELEDGTLELIDGHLRAETVGDTAVPVLVLDVDEAEADKLLATLDPLAALAGVDTQRLEDLLATVETDSEALQLMLDGLAEDAGIELEPQIVEDEVPEPPVDPITKPGDLWLLGEHRVLCGDSTKAEDVERLMGGEKADLCFTSPPYAQQRDYTAEGKAKVADWDGLMCGVFANLPMSEAGQVLVNLGLIHREGEWIPYWEHWIEWMRKQGWRRFGWYVWDQGSGLPGDWQGRFAPSHEFIWHFNKQAVKPIKFIETKEESQNVEGRSHTIGFRKQGGSAPASSPDKVGQAFKIPDSVWRFTRHVVNDIARLNHPATYPVSLPSHAMQSWEGFVYDPFLGSGTTLIAAEQLGRRCFGMEISLAYCDVIVKRWETLTGRKATLAT